MKYGCKYILEAAARSDILCFFGRGNAMSIREFKVRKYSRSPNKLTPSGREKSDRNWSWPLTRMVLVRGH